MFTVSPTFIPSVFGVYVNVRVTEVATVPVVSLLRYINNGVTPVTVVFAGIEALPVTNIPANTPVVLANGISFLPLSVTSFVVCVKFARFATTDWLADAS